MRRKLLGLLIAMCAGLGLFTMVGPASPAGAVPVACPVGDQGWYWGYSNDRVFQCVIDGNHMIINQHRAGVVRLVFDAWIPTNDLNVVVYGYAGPGIGNSNVIACGKNTSWASAGAYMPGPSGWERFWQWSFDSAPNTYYQAGVVNHWNGGSDEYSVVANLYSGLCPGHHGVKFGW